VHKFPKEEALIWATIFAVVLIAVGSTHMRAVVQLTSCSRSPVNN
jgi:hypothetical protein